MQNDGIELLDDADLDTIAGGDVDEIDPDTGGARRARHLRRGRQPHGSHPRGLRLPQGAGA
jgi:hypothetical protein